MGWQKHTWLAANECSTNCLPSSRSRESLKGHSISIHVSKFLHSAPLMQVSVSFPEYLVDIEWRWCSLNPMKYQVSSLVTAQVWLEAVFTKKPPKMAPSLPLMFLFPKKHKRKEHFIHYLCLLCVLFSPPQLGVATVVENAGMITDPAHNSIIDTLLQDILEARLQ